MLTLTHPKLPSQCFVHVPSNPPARSIALVRLGVTGCYPVNNAASSTVATHDEARKLVREMNAEAGVTVLQAHCMETGSMFGWEAPGADPDTYTPEMVAAMEKAEGGN